MVLGDDSGSRLYWELVDPGLAEQCEMSHHEYEGAGIFLTYMSCAPEEAAENLQLIAEVYRRAAAEAITAAELEQAKSKVRSRMVLSSERPRGRLFSVGSDWIYRREYRPVEEELATVAAITVDDAAAVLRQISAGAEHDDQHRPGGRLPVPSPSERRLGRGRAGPLSLRERVRVRAGAAQPRSHHPRSLSKRARKEFAAQSVSPGGTADSSPARRHA